MFSTTILFYTIIIIGLSTYLIVFNLNNLVLQVSKSYQSLRDQLVKKIKDTKDGDEPGFWSHKGRRFDVFTPLHERAHASERWIVTFLLRRTFAKVLAILNLQRSAKENEEEKSLSPSSSAGYSFHSSSGLFSSLVSPDPSPSPSVSGDSLNLEVETNDLNHHENHQEPDDLRGGVESNANSTAHLDQTPTYQGPRTTQGPIDRQTSISPPVAVVVAQSGSPSIAICSEQTGDETMSTQPATLSEPPLPSAKTQDYSCRSIIQTFEMEGKEGHGGRQWNCLGVETSREWALDEGKHIFRSHTTYA